MNILIATEPDDHHAILVKLALEKTGHLVDLLFTADHPTKQRNTIFIDNKNYQWISTDGRSPISNDKHEVVWWRRARKPYIPKNLLHPDDYPIVTRENASFHESLSKTIATNAWWVNSREAAYKARSKLLQLKIAADCGLNIPTTLCTNDPQNIREFLCKMENVIYKPLTLNLWPEKEHIKIAYTSKLNSSDLSDDTLLQLVPGIYQKEIKKNYELRITCFGDYIVSAKLNSQSHLLGKTDWRRIPDEELSIEPYQLPNPIKEKIQKFMHKMGLVFGALDFIVTPEEEYFFLEVNEQGQFLWIEDSNPDFNMLDIFVNFLTNKSTNFQWEPQKTQHHIIQYADEVEDITAWQMEQHVHLNQAMFIHSEGL
ncbi:MAG: hypothetical protein BGO90_15020 [Legionella sp. 40-6]|nr:MAG: hypothetical protein BGO90_15020 [Legionella sp. 40-6]